MAAGVCALLLARSPTIGHGNVRVQDPEREDPANWAVLPRAVQLLFTHAGCRAVACVPVHNDVSGQLEAVLLLASREPEHLKAVLCPTHA